MKALMPTLRWLLALLLLLGLPLAASAAVCSAYKGQVFINELRIGSSGNSSTANQIELYNSGNVAQSVWSTWQLVVYYRSGTTGTLTKRGGYFLSSGFSVAGQFIYNSTKRINLRNRTSRYVDVALVDASGNFIDYIAITGPLQTVPTCMGTVAKANPSSSSDAKGDLARTTDGGSWPASVTATSVHTIGASNVCTVGSDLSVSNGVSPSKAIVNTTPVSYTITVTNKSCSNTVSNIVINTTGQTASNFSGLSGTISTGAANFTATGVTWNITSLTKGSTATLTVAGTPIVLGTLNVTAAVAAPSGLTKTTDDSATSALLVTDFTYVGFDLSTDTVTEGSDLSYSAVINATVAPASNVTISYTVSGTATSGDTDLLGSGTVVLNPTDPQTPDSTSIDFVVKNDAIHEPTKTIVLTLTGVSSSDPSVKLDTSAKVLTLTLLDDDTELDHYELSLPSASVGCVASTVTVTACLDSSSPCSNPSTALGGQTATLATSAGTLGATSVSFNASGQASTTLSYPSAPNGANVTVTLSGEQTLAANARKCCPVGGTCTTANSCATSFSGAGFVIASAANASATTLPAMGAGNASGTYYLRAVKTNSGACQAALSGSNTVNWSYQCNNPATCSTGNLLSVTGSAGATAVAGNANGSSANSTAVTMTFDANGNAPFSFNPADVGQITLQASKPAGGALLTALSGTSNAFVVKPAGFALSAIRCSSYAAGSCATGAIASPGNNPGANSAAGSAFIQAGQPFSVTVTAVNAAGNATPNFGKESPAEGVVLDSTLVLPTGGDDVPLSNPSAFGAFSGGAATGTTFAWAEVGIITLTPSVADGDYLGAGPVTGAVSGPVGRFIPASFALNSASVTHRSAMACAAPSDFSYLGEVFQLNFGLTALDSGGTVLHNYSGSFAKFDPSVASGWNLAGVAGGTAFTTANGRLSLGTATGSWTNGEADNLTLTATAQRAAAPDGPFAADFGIAPQDSDGVRMGSYDINVAGAGNDHATVANVALRFGRLRLANAIGDQTRPLGLPLSAQHWNSSTGTFETNTLDNCTVLPASAVSFGKRRGTLAQADLGLTATNVALSNGMGTLKLKAPTGGRRGTVDLALSLGSTATDASCLQTWTPDILATTGAGLGHLRGAWCASTYSKDPSARASFGLYRGADSMVYMRENH